MTNKNTCKILAISNEDIQSYHNSEKSEGKFVPNYDYAIISFIDRCLFVSFIKDKQNVFQEKYAHGTYPVLDGDFVIIDSLLITQPEQKEETFRVGDRVFQYFEGWGTITDIDVNSINTHPISIEFDSGKIFHYQINEKIVPLSFTEYNFITGGWSQERLPEIGSFGWFWADEYDLVSEEVVYGKLQKVEDGVYYTNENQYNCFSTKNPFEK